MDEAAEAALAVKILGNCARAMDPAGKVVLAEVVIGAANSVDDGPLLDIHMMVLPGAENAPRRSSRSFSLRRVYG